MNKTNYDVIIIGAGPAGLIAGGFLAECGRDVLILEKNHRVGRKLAITGKGRCNVTNNCEPFEFVNAVRKNSKFILSAVNNFSPADVMDFFEQNGVPLKTERGNRVFPISDKALDVVDALLAFAKNGGAEVKTECEVKAILQDGEKVVGVSVLNKKIYAKAILIATGGMSYPLTGSTGDGYRFAKQAGHKIVIPEPSLVPIESREHWCKELQGLSLKNVTLKVLDKSKNKVIYNELGEMLFTHFGVSGPLVLSASSHMSADKMADYEIYIDMKPALDEETLDKRIRRDFDKFLNRDLQNALIELLPRKMIPVIIKLLGVSPEIKVNQITKEVRKSLVSLIKNIKVTPKGFRPIEEAIVTSGGVDVSGINPKTMQSKICNTLFFAGEVIDLDA
ncbi:MAG: NAD(P)/FAD-dependent oxidoreductase, partial [Oscillospiraceae bacterium]|nr:NAD(P)/FAD-dependent oxidoreductase [Oscillospiraceae bacterium]